MSQSQPRLPRTIPTSIAMSHQSTSVARNRQVTSSWLPQARTVHVRCPPAKHNNRLKSPSSYSNVVPPQSQFKKKTQKLRAMTPTLVSITQLPRVFATRRAGWQVIPLLSGVVQEQDDDYLRLLAISRPINNLLVLINCVAVKRQLLLGTRLIG